jgi:hypothetical protein
MCGSRTGEWSLPGVMSDWQHCVDWFVAKYCRCRWITSAKGRFWWGLQVWRRQVGLVRGTRCPAGSSAGYMVARTARWSHGRFLGGASNSRSSWDYVGVESWVVIGRGYTEFAWFSVVHQKTTGFLGWSTKPRPKNLKRRCNSIGPVWPVGLTGVRRRVTTPSEIIPYYLLNHSIWSLSNNKESSRWVLLGLRPVNHLKTQRGSNVCIKTPTKESPECLTNEHQIPCRVHYYKRSSLTWK